jgi:sensor histidine kinase YesM
MDVKISVLPQTNDELTKLSEIFNEMVVRLNKLLNEYKEKAEIERKLKEEELVRLRVQAQLRESELKLMQARINPHFLFNTLNMISQKAYMENAKNSMEMTKKLAELLRYSLNSLDRTVTLGEEVENIRDYCYIQQQRFGSRLIFNIELPTVCAEAVMPSLILQPLIENSFMHGFKKYDTDLIVGIEVKSGHGRICAKIFDNGQGMPAQTCVRLNEIARGGGNYANESIGIYNVSTRLRLFFNGDVVMRFLSVPDTYTEILLDFPLEKHKIGNSGYV